MNTLKLSFTYPNPPAEQVLTNMVTDLNTELVRIDPSTYAVLYPGSLTGLKDASGANGNLFYKDASIFIKMNNLWRSITVTDLSMG